VSKIAKIGIFACLIVVVLTVLYYRQFNQIKACEIIQAGAGLDQLIETFGQPINKIDSWYYFNSAFGAAGPISAKVSHPSGKVLALKCTEDGGINWAIE